MVIGVGTFMFGLKWLEMWRETLFYFMVGTHRGSRSLAIRILQLIIHVRTMEAVARKEARCIGGSARELIPQGSLTGTDVNMAMAQQRPSPEEPLLMFPPHMHVAQQHHLPKNFQRLVRDKDGKRIEGPQLKYQWAEEWYALQLITIQVQTGAQQIVTLPGVQVAPDAPSLPERVVRISEVIAEPEEDPWKKRRKARFSDQMVGDVSRSGMSGEPGATECDSWIDDEEVEDLDDFEELDMDTEDKGSEDEWVVIPPRRRQVKVQLNSQGRQVAFSVGSPPNQPI